MREKDSSARAFCVASESGKALNFPSSLVLPCAKKLGLSVMSVASSSVVMAVDSVVKEAFLELVGVSSFSSLGRFLDFFSFFFLDFFSAVTASSIASSVEPALVFLLFAMVVQLFGSKMGCLLFCWLLALDVDFSFRVLNDWRTKVRTFKRLSYILAYKKS